MRHSIRLLVWSLNEGLKVGTVIMNDIFKWDILKTMLKMNNIFKWRHLKTAPALKPSLLKLPFWVYIFIYLMSVFKAGTDIYIRKPKE